MVLLAGYILLFEENEWLKRCVIKAISLLVFFSLLSMGINLVPNVINFINSIVLIFGGKFYVAAISNLVNAICSMLNIIEEIVFISLGVKALGLDTISVSIVDNLIDKYMAR